MKKRSIEEQYLKDLLAIIHRDGGHRTQAVGLEQSVKEAKIKIDMIKHLL